MITITTITIQQQQKQKQQKPSSTPTSTNTRPRQVFKISSPVNITTLHALTLHNLPLIPYFTSRFPPLDKRRRAEHREPSSRARGKQGEGKTQHTHTTKGKQYTHTHHHHHTHQPDLEGGGARSLGRPPLAPPPPRTPSLNTRTPAYPLHQPPLPPPLPPFPSSTTAAPASAATLPCGLRP